MKGKTGIIDWGEGKTSKVVIKEVDTYSYLPTDYWLDYLPGETHKPLVHPDYGHKSIIKAPILLPEGILVRVFTADVSEEEKSTFDYKLKQYIKDNFDEEAQHEAKMLFRDIKRISGEDYIIEKYFNKTK